MNKKYKLRYLDIFYRDLNQILKYIKYDLNNPESANRLFDEIIEELNKRIFSPESYEVFITRKNKSIKYYRIYIRNYIIFYIVKGDIIEVRRILYKKRNIGKII